jgi:hypothetical protein
MYAIYITEDDQEIVMQPLDTWDEDIIKQYLRGEGVEASYSTEPFSVVGRSGRAIGVDVASRFEPDAEYQALNKIEVIELLRTVSGMDDAGELAFRKDANLELFWMKWNNDVGNLIHRDHALTDTVLSAVVASGHITEAHKAGIFAAWPTV